MILPSLVGAADICIDWENNTEPEIKISEADLTKEAAYKAQKAIGELIESGKFEWYQPKNLQKIIYGYLLKKRALNAIELRGNKEIKSLHDVKRFCHFIIEDAFYYGRS